MRFTLLLLASLALAATPTSDLINQFDKLIQIHGRAYSAGSDEYVARFSAFLDNVDRIDLVRKQNPSARFALNKFFDMSKAEFMAIYKNEQIGSVVNRMCDADGATTSPAMLTRDTPTSWDWRDHKAVNPVKDQEQCGSCWAFSTVSNIESMWAIAGNPLASFSEQQVVDCDDYCDKDGNCDQGCNGGLMWTGMSYVIDNGLEPEDDYKYRAVTGRCRSDSSKFVGHISNYTCISVPGAAADEGKMASILASTGPFSIAINAGPFQFYDSGIMDPSDCNIHDLDHGVNIVGYGVSDSTDFWIIRNSWGEGWGEQGYARLIRGKNACGVAQAVIQAIV